MHGKTQIFQAFNSRPNGYNWGDKNTRTQEQKNPGINKASAAGGALRVSLK